MHIFPPDCDVKEFTYNLVWRELEDGTKEYRFQLKDGSWYSDEIYKTLEEAMASRGVAKIPESMEKLAN